jgi:hypothetical protein
LLTSSLALDCIYAADRLVCTELHSSQRVADCCREDALYFVFLASELPLLLESQSNFQRLTAVH